MTTTKIELRQLRAGFAKTEVLHGLDLPIYTNKSTALIGPSGCGKSTLLKCLNRMHELVDGAYLSGEVLLDNQNIYTIDIDPVLVRRRVGMVFQRPNPFPHMSIQDNVLSGLRLTNKLHKYDKEELVASALGQSALWGEVKDRLSQPAHTLSGGQQQRLCIARTIAVKPQCILMDEPCSALDPIATTHIEELIFELKKVYTIVIVTHNMQQASRVSDYTAFLLLGSIIEYSETSILFTKPSCQETEDYITGKFG